MKPQQEERVRPTGEEVRKHYAHLAKPIDDRQLLPATTYASQAKMLIDLMEHAPEPDLLTSIVGEKLDLAKKHCEDPDLLIEISRMYLNISYVFSAEDAIDKLLYLAPDHPIGLQLKEEIREITDWLIFG